jgi:hypothetical protein
MTLHSEPITQNTCGATEPMRFINCIWIVFYRSLSLPYVYWLFLVTIFFQTGLTLSRHSSDGFMCDTTTKAYWPVLVVVLSHDFIAVCNHGASLIRRVVELSGGYIAGICVIRIRKIYDGQLFSIIASEKRCAFVKSFGHECFDGGNVWHSCQPAGLRHIISMQDFGPIGPVVISICRVVVNEEHINPTSWL